MRGVPRDGARLLRRPSASQSIAEDARGTGDDRASSRRIKLQPLHDAKTVAQRRGQHPGAGGGADQGERRQIDLDPGGRRAFADHDVDLVVLHRRIEDLLDHRRQAVDLVTNSTSCGCRLVSSAARSPAFSITGPEVTRRLTPSSLAMTCAERGLAEPRRAEDQHVVQRLAAALGRLDVDLHLLAHRLLAEVFVRAGAGGCWPPGPRPRGWRRCR